MNAELWPPGHLQMAAIIIISWDRRGWGLRQPVLIVAVRRIVLVTPTHVTLIEGGVLVAIHGLVS